MGDLSPFLKIRILKRLSPNYFGQEITHESDFLTCERIASNWQVGCVSDAAVPYGRAAVRSHRVFGDLGW